MAWLEMLQSVFPSACFQSTHQLHMQQLCLFGLLLEEAECCCDVNLNDHGLSTTQPRSPLRACCFAVLCHDEMCFGVMWCGRGMHVSLALMCPPNQLTCATACRCRPHRALSPVPPVCYEVIRRCESRSHACTLIQFLPSTSAGLKLCAFPAAYPPAAPLQAKASGPN